jgi:hypothetical protein
MIFAIAARIVVLVAGLIYTGLVLTGYATEGPHYQPRLSVWDPIGSALRLLIWSGVRILHIFLTLLRLILDQLFAASGEVAAWTVERSSPDIQRKLRQRFL